VTVRPPIQRPRRTDPLYAVIEATLRDEIAAGVQPLGSCLPTEHALCDRFQASRFTIRQALNGLRAVGMIEPRPGIGTFVVAMAPKAALVQTLTSVEELLQYPGEMLRENQHSATIAADAALAAFLGCTVGEEWLLLQATRRSVGADLPLCWMEAWVAPRFESVARVAERDGTPLLVLLDRHFGQRACHAQVQMTAGRVTANIAAPLMAAEDSPALEITRRYRDAGGEVFLATRLIHPEGRFSLNFEFQMT
jgi:GntR family transcriptional regulator